MPRWCTVAHLFDHQTHHRGEVTTLVMQAGHPGVTDLVQLWSTLIGQHPKLQIPDVRKDDIKNILRSGSAIVDSINTIRIARA